MGRVGVALGAVAVVAPILFAFVFGRAVVVGHLIDWLDSETGGSRSLITVAGWLTAALAPLAARTFMIDSEERNNRLGDGGHNGDVAVLTTRARAASGHGIAPRPTSYWIRRAPLVLALAVAILFWPLHGDVGPTQWRSTAAGHAFTQGWIVSAIASALALSVGLLDEILVKTRGIAPHRVSLWAAIVLPLVGLGVALI